MKSLKIQISLRGRSNALLSFFGCFYSGYVKLELQKHQFTDVLQDRCS